MSMQATTLWYGSECNQKQINMHTHEVAKNIHNQKRMVPAMHDMGQIKLVLWAAGLSVVVHVHSPRPQRDQCNAEFNAS